MSPTVMDVTHLHNDQEEREDQGELLSLRVMKTWLIVKYFRGFRKAYK